MKARKINLSVKVAGVMGDGAIYWEDTQRITESPKQQNLQKDRWQGRSGSPGTCRRGTRYEQNNGILEVAE